MKVGILSDTHDHFANMVYVIERFKEFEVQKILHAGDIASPTGAMAIDTIAKDIGIQADIVAVFGNNDGDKWRYAKYKKIPEHDINVTIDYHADAVEGKIEDKKYVLYHGESPILIRALREAANHDLLITGHNHRARIDSFSVKSRKILHVNPGTVSGNYFHRVIQPSFAVYESVKHVAKIIYFDFQIPAKRYFWNIDL